MSVYRNKCVLTDNEDLEHLYTFNNFPISFGSVDALSDPNNDIFKNMSWWITKRGVIQLNPLIDINLLYTEYHGSGTSGNLWKSHNMEFSDFISIFKPQNIIEIGGGIGLIANIYLEKEKNSKWTIVDPSGKNTTNCDRLNVYKTFFNDTFKSVEQVDTIVHSHTLEHIYDPKSFLININNFLKVGQYHIFSIPYLEKWLKNKYSNALMFEHTLYLTESIIEELLEKTGFKINMKKYFKNHSIFYASEKIESINDELIDINITKIKHSYEYAINRHVYLDYINYYDNIIYNLNKNIDCFMGEIFIYGSHIFTQILINKGINTAKIVSILDNDINKHYKRLYGTNLIVKPIDFIRTCNSPAVILYAGIYTDEIKKQLVSIRTDILFL